MSYLTPPLNGTDRLREDDQQLKILPARSPEFTAAAVHVRTFATI
ncbi:hypothetical protein ABZZ36_38780 [Actinacidiphila glaucinigra]